VVPETEGAIPTEGRTENAWEDPARQTSATIKEIRNDFMMINKRVREDALLNGRLERD
jgi:hypothetical protein